MTPEDRATLCAELFLKTDKVSGKNRAHVIKTVATAIRYAVRAEQIKCANIVTATAVQHSTVPAVEALEAAAKAIRERTP